MGWCSTKQIFIAQSVSKNIWSKKTITPAKINPEKLPSQKERLVLLSIIFQG